jgi:hypothetical protein
MFCSHGKTFLVVAVIGHWIKLISFSVSHHSGAGAAIAEAATAAEEAGAIVAAGASGASGAARAAGASKWLSTWPPGSIKHGRLPQCWKAPAPVGPVGPLVHWSCLPAERRDDLDGFGRTWISWNPGDPEIQIYPAEQLNSTIPRNLYQRFGQMAPYSELKLGSTSSATP